MPRSAQMLNNTNRSNDFIVGNCPSCDKYVRVPVDTNPMSTVKCPMCAASFELALMIEGVVPTVQVVDENLPITETPDNTLSRKSVNAIDTPEIFHVKSKQDYTPITEKKNGKFVVPEQLAKGVKKRKNVVGVVRHPAQIQNGLAHERPVIRLQLPYLR